MVVGPLPPADDARLPHPTLEPIVRRIDAIGVVEHAVGRRPTAAHGHCTDDAGRALGVAVRIADDPRCGLVASACLRQLERALQRDGVFALRLDEDGRPRDERSSDDASARALWGLAVAATDRTRPSVAAAASHLIERVAPFESTHPRAASHAVLAGAALLDADPRSVIGRQLLHANLGHVPREPWAPAWRWPEPRLTYGNAVLIEALLAAGSAIDDRSMVTDAIDLLAWLTEREWDGRGHFSFTPTSGRGPGEGPGFDQQPIEPWTMADAALLAGTVTGDDRWFDVVAWCAAWFDGANDKGVRVWDPATGAAFDGLTPNGVNANQGTESTIAFIATMWAHRRARVRCVQAAPSRASR